MKFEVFNKSFTFDFDPVTTSKETSFQMSNQQVNGIIPCHSCGNTWRYLGHEQSLYCKRTCIKASANLAQIQQQQFLVPPCAICGKRYRDSRYPNSPCCSRTCMENYKKQYVPQPVQRPVQQTHVPQGTPLCQICYKSGKIEPAGWDKKRGKFAAGCKANNYQHSRDANQLGIFHPV